MHKCHLPLVIASTSLSLEQNLGARRTITQRGMSSGGRVGSVGIIIAISAIRHMWSEMLVREQIGPRQACTSAHLSASFTWPSVNAQTDIPADDRLTPSRIQPDRFCTLSCSSMCRKAIVSSASFPLDLA